MRLFYNWMDLEAEDHGLPSSCCKIKAITGDKLQLIHAEFEPAGEYEMHSHPHEQFGIMLQGRMRLIVGDEEKLVGPGDIWHVPPNVIHGGKLLGDAPVIFVDVFHPIREDVLQEMQGKREERLKRGSALRQ